MRPPKRSGNLCLPHIRPAHLPWRASGPGSDDPGRFGRERLLQTSDDRPMLRRAHAWCALIVGIACASPAAASAAPLQLVRVGTFSSPMFVTAPRTDTSRLFVVEKAGRIQVVVDGTKRQFLDLTGVVTSNAGERGLSSMAFAADYETSGRFYVQYTANATLGAVTVAEYRRSAIDPNAADPGSG